MAAKGREDPSIKKQINEMGEELCKERPNDPKCQQFMSKKAEAKPVAKKKAAGKAPTASAPAGKRLQEQGFSGKKVKHQTD